MTKQKRGAAPQKAARNPQQRVSAPLTVTLDAESSAIVRQFAEILGEHPADVANGLILDCGPTMLEDWHIDRANVAAGRPDVRKQSRNKTN